MIADEPIYSITSKLTTTGIRLFMQYDNYDGANRKWLEVVIFFDKFSMIDPNRNRHPQQPSAMTR